MPPGSNLRREIGQLSHDGERRVAAVDDSRAAHLVGGVIFYL